MAILSPFDLASFSPLVNVAGTTPTGTDLRRSYVVGAAREWGALEYNSALVIDATYITPFDLAPHSPLINLAGTSPATTDMRGTAVIGAQREWGALEYDPDLLTTDDVPGSSYYDARVAASSDDARQNVGTMGLTAASISASNGNQYLGFRWDGVGIANGETINFAQLWLTPVDTGNDSPNGMTIGVQDADDPATFTTTTNDITDRALLATLETWNGLDLGADELLAADLTDQIQAVVDRGGFASGNAIVSVLRGDNDGDLSVIAWDGTPTKAARLVINFGGGGGATLDGALALVGVGALVSVAQRLRHGAASLTGVGAATLSPAVTRHSALSLTGAGSFSGAGARLREALLSITGVGVIVAGGQRVREGSLTTAGAGVLTQAAQRLRETALDLPGVGSLTTAASKIAQGAVSLPGAGSLSVAGQRLREATMALAGAGAFAVSASRLRSAALDLPGVASLSGAGQRLAAGAVAFAGEGLLGLAGGLAGLVEGAISFIGAGSFSGAASRITQAALTLTGEGDFAGAGQRLREGLLSLPGVGTLASVGLRLREGALSLVGAGSFTIAAGRIASAAVSFVGAASLALATEIEPIITGLVNLTAKARQVNLTARRRITSFTAKRRDED